MSNDKDRAAELRRAVNRIAKWRALFTGWQIGTRPKGDPECDAISDHRELTILLRVEGNAMAGLLMRKGVFTQAEWQQAVIDEVELYEADLEHRFPGVKATDDGLVMDRRVLPWMKGWKP